MACTRCSRFRRRTPLVPVWLASAVVLLGAEQTILEISGEPLADLLRRAFRPGVQAALVRAELEADAEGWVIAAPVHGSSEPGQRLAFAECARVLRIGSTPEFLRSLLTRSPVVEAEVETPRRLRLAAGGTLSDSAPPRPDDRYLLLFERPSPQRPDRQEGWGFAVQTVGDLYLLRGNRVYRTAWTQREGRPGELVWAPVADVSEAALIDMVRAGLSSNPPD